MHDRKNIIIACYLVQHNVNVARSHPEGSSGISRLNLSLIIQYVLQILHQSQTAAISQQNQVSLTVLPR